jgi:hypothetical protein
MDAPSVKSSTPAPPVKSPPHGGGGGLPFDHLQDRGDKPPLGRIVKVFVTRGAMKRHDVIRSLEVLYANGEVQRHGNPDGHTCAELTLGDDECITAIGGRAGGYVDRLWFRLSSGRAFPAWDGGGGAPFVEERAGHVVTGFHGRAGGALDQIGCYFEVPRVRRIEIAALAFLGDLAVEDRKRVELEPFLLENREDRERYVTRTAYATLRSADRTIVRELPGVSARLAVAQPCRLEKQGVVVEFACDDPGLVTDDEHVATRVERLQYGASVLPHRAVRVCCSAAEQAFSVSWEATARVLFDHGPSQQRTLHGTVSGTRQSNPRAELEPPAAAPAAPR